ncbi:MAG TPA: Lrp/AsnC family transcriptional regulator [Acidobacteriota bacterium]|nr:Lrp/AsnC family transcriptional regulator [Acidobacteriota bacterium]
MPDSRIINDKDIRILNIIQNDGRSANVDIAKRLGMAPSGVLERIRKLQKRGVIRGYEARIDPEALGLGMVAFVFVKTAESVGETGVARKIAEIPEVLEVHTLAGEDCYLVKVRVANPQDLSRLLRKRFGVFKSIRSTRTSIVLDTFKETAKLPLPEVKQKRGRRGE